MSRTLNLIDILLTSGRNLFRMGRCTEALDILTRLAQFRKLPKHVLEELQALLAEIQLQQKNYKAARRHLTAAIAIRPLKAEYYMMMAAAIEEDDAADLERAEMYYDRAVHLDPHQPAYWIDYGCYLMTIDKTKQALAAIRKAYAIGAADAKIVAKIGEILRREGYAEEATAKLRAALFHNHGSAAFRQIWQRHQFDMVRAEQEKKRRPGAGNRPVILPFVPAPSQGKYVAMGEKTFRIDQAERTSEPKNKTPEPARRPPKKG